jgi:hypothetical protein
MLPWVGGWRSDALHIPLASRARFAIIIALLELFQ